ncbi:MAG: DUF1580 domain-containing protein [Phycisphaerae bacterium]|nr:DUF1580 domain-containing protein [Phycisphaerae bacterium]
MRYFFIVALILPQECAIGSVFCAQAYCDNTRQLFNAIVLFAYKNMIDLINENMIPLADVPGYLPKRPNGKKIHLSAIYRWAAKGIKGVVLETAKIGGASYTSLEAIKRFSDQLTIISRGADRINGTPVSRQREIDRAAQRVSIELGISTDGKSPSTEGNVS